VEWEEISYLGPEVSALVQGWEWELAWALRASLPAHGLDLALLGQSHLDRSGKDDASLAEVQV